MSIRTNPQMQEHPVLVLLASRPTTPYTPTTYVALGSLEELEEYLTMVSGMVMSSGGEIHDFGGDSGVFRNYKRGGNPPLYISITLVGVGKYRLGGYSQSPGRTITLGDILALEYNDA